MENREKRWKTAGLQPVHLRGLCREEVVESYLVFFLSTKRVEKVLNLWKSQVNKWKTIFGHVSFVHAVRLDGFFSVEKLV